jgi:hypothetical protein
LLEDPHDQATTCIKKLADYEQSGGLTILRSNINLTSALDSAIAEGKWVLLENVDN